MRKILACTIVVWVAATNAFPAPGGIPLKALRPATYTDQDNDNFVYDLQGICNDEMQPVDFRKEACRSMALTMKVDRVIQAQDEHIRDLNRLPGSRVQTIMISGNGTVNTAPPTEDFQRSLVAYCGTTNRCGKELANLAEDFATHVPGPFIFATTTSPRAAAPVSRARDPNVDPDESLKAVDQIYDRQLAQIHATSAPATPPWHEPVQLQPPTPEQPPTFGSPAVDVRPRFRVAVNLDHDYDALQDADRAERRWDH